MKRREFIAGLGGAAVAPMVLWPPAARAQPSDKPARIGVFGGTTSPITGPASRAFLDELGNPYDAIGADATGRTSIDWGVYGVPETFLIGRDGRIAFKLVGPITPHNYQAVLKPAIEKALGGS